MKRHKMQHQNDGKDTSVSGYKLEMSQQLQRGGKEAEDGNVTKDVIR